MLHLHLSASGFLRNSRCAVLRPQNVIPRRRSQDSPGRPESRWCAQCWVMPGFGSVGSEVQGLQASVRGPKCISDGPGVVWAATSWRPQAGVNCE